MQQRDAVREGERAREGGERQVQRDPRFHFCNLQGRGCSHLGPPHLQIRFNIHVLGFFTCSHTFIYRYGLVCCLFVAAFDPNSFLKLRTLVWRAYIKRITTVSVRENAPFNCFKIRNVAAIACAVCHIHISIICSVCHKL